MLKLGVERTLLIALAAGAAVFSVTAANAQTATSPAPAGAAVAGAAEDKVQAVTLQYSVEAALAYFDVVSRPERDAIDRPDGAGLGFPDSASARARGPEATRTLGLKRVRLGATWRAANGAAFTLVLRPDALTRSEEARGAKARAAAASAAAPTDDTADAPDTDDGGGDAEPADTAASSADAYDEARDFDARAGSPYRAAPPIRFLDSYFLTLAPTRSLSASAGVFEEMAPRRAAYPECLAFGLETRLPTHFSGVRLRWQHFATGAAPAPVGVAADGYVYDGNEDRAEAVSTRDGTFDRAPVARDPYHGGALALAWYPSTAFSIGLTGGTHDSKDMDAAALGVEVARVNEAYGQLAVTADSLMATTPLRLALDARYARERWRGGEIDTASRAQNSLSLTAAISMSERHWLTFGAHTGRSDDDPARWGLAEDRRVPVEGYQVDIGYLAIPGRGLELQLMLAHERRQVQLDGNERVGAFIDEDGGNHATARRFGLQLLYRLDEET